MDLYVIKMVADTTNHVTLRILRTYWDRLSPDERIKVLEEMGHSSKWYAHNFDELTGEIQSKIITREVIIQY